MAIIEGSKESSSEQTQRSSKHRVELFFRKRWLFVVSAVLLIAVPLHFGERQRWLEAVNVVYGLQFTQERYLEQYGQYKSAHPNPPSWPEGWGGWQWIQSGDWEQLGVSMDSFKHPSTLRHQYEVRAGQGACVPEPSTPQTCEGIKSGPWFWAVARDGNQTIYINNGMDNVAIVEH